MAGSFIPELGSGRGFQGLLLFPGVGIWDVPDVRCTEGQAARLIRRCQRHEVQAVSVLASFGWSDSSVMGVPP